jgi:hypothetical protein
MFILGNRAVHFANLGCRRKLHPRVRGNFIHQRRSTAKQNVNGVVHVECVRGFNRHADCHHLFGVLDAAQFDDRLLQRMAEFDFTS